VKILTLDNLRKNNVIVVDWCCMCKRNGDFINHVFLHCEVARIIINVKWSCLEE
jgi:hypothetical protein